MLGYARRLRDIEDGLKASEPGLAAKYAIFNELVAADGPARTETLRGPALMRRAADSGGMAARVAAVIVLLSVVVSGLVIGTLLQPAARACPAASHTVASRTSSSRTAESQATASRTEAASQTAEAQALSEVAASAAAMPVTGAAGRCGAYVGR